ncbi:MAG TPA: T9SS type A sorting domain-containing protein [Candidatus Kapabacteria bacterium]|nr:T9SS type A sorting domain-containing protein [Candidatus Kapabacteria bacterium]
MATTIRGTYDIVRRVLPAALIAWVILGGRAIRAQTFSDGTFNDADWTSTVLPCVTPGSTVVAAQDTREGNPPGSRTTIHHYQGPNPGILVVHVRRGASYNPSTQGGIASLDYSYDLRHYTGPEQWAVGYSPLIVQNGTYYRLNTWDAIYPDAWQPFSGAGLTPESFTNFCGTGPAHPDFSCGGSRIDFGYATGNSNPTAGTGFQDRSSGIDNWNLTLHPAQSALTIAARPATSICAGDSVRITAGGCVSYHWSPATGLSCVDCASPVASPPVTTTYVVDAIDAAGCSRRDSLHITVAPVRAATRRDVVVCSGGPVVLPCEAGSSYRWTPATGLDCDTCRNPVVRQATDMTYTVAVGNGNSCFTVDTIVVRVMAPTATSVSGNVTICRGDSTMLVATGGAAYQWNPASGLTCADCPSPIAAPDTTTLYHVHVIASNGCTADDSVLVEVKMPTVLTVRIPRSLFARPGTGVRMPVILEGRPQPGTIAGFDFGVSYAPDVIRVDSLVLAGTLCEGWAITNLVHDRGTGHTTAHLTAPPGGWLAGEGTLLEVAATSYVGSADTSELPVTFAPGATPCQTFRTVSGHVLLDSICGLPYRLIEWIKGTYSLDGNHPNPFNPTTTIAFSLGLDGATTLSVYNALGSRVATLIDGYLGAGTYETVWDASSQPSGVYYYELRSGTWSRRASMVLMK